ncbi:hypothetical protein [Erwinia sp. E_sp_B04_7]|uniref:hypothetical protein n=1 Tax=unclassified Erwinia TaxID=2622719 RepID=UPI0030CE1204
MTARERIKEFLSGQRFVSTKILHDHIQSLGFNRVSSCSALSKMVSRGEVISNGHHIHTYVKLNEAYKPKAASARQKANHANLGKIMGRVPRKPKTEAGDNDIFELCRKHSNIYAMDKLLREVRV